MGVGRHWDHIWSLAQRPPGPRDQFKFHTLSVTWGWQQFPGVPSLSLQLQGLIGGQGLNHRYCW